MRIVDGVENLPIVDPTSLVEGVPARTTDVGHRFGVAGMSEEPLLGLLACAALDAHAVVAKEAEDLLVGLDNHGSLPRLVLPSSGLGKAEVEDFACVTA